MGGRNAGPR